MSAIDIKYIEDKFHLKDFNSAFERIESYLKDNPPYGELLYYKALCLLKFEKYEEAINTLFESIQLDPKNSEKYNSTISTIYSKIGLTSFAAKIFDLSLKSYNLALQYNNKSSEANYGLGILALERKDFNEALVYFNSSIDLNEKNFYSLYKLGLTYSFLSDNVNAKKNYLQAILINPKYIDAYYSLAQLYFDNNDNELGLNTLRDAYMMDPKNTFLSVMILSKMYDLKLYNDLNTFLDVNCLDESFKPNFYYSYKFLLNKIDNKIFNHNFISNPFDKIKVYDINPSNNAFIETVDKLSTLEAFDISPDLPSISSKGFKFGDKSIIRKYFLNFSDIYLNDINTNDSYFKNITKDLSCNLIPNLDIIKSLNSNYIDEYSSHHSFLKGIFFFLDNYSPIKQNLELNFTFKYINNDDTYNNTFTKNIVVDTYCFLVFPSFLKYKIISKSKIDLTYGYVEFNLSG